MHKKFTRPQSLKDVETHYCPGCGHGIVHNLVALAIDQLDLRQETIGIAPVGCAVLAYDYWNFDVCEAAHGRALAVATAIKRCQPQNLVFTYQGDGDLASIGLAETIHAANRGEDLTCIFINNACYGMTGGQMAPTTLTNQVTTTTPYGRNPKNKEGWPFKVSEMLAQLCGVSFIVRSSLTSPKGVKDTLEYIKRGFRNQISKKGFSLIEILSPCPTIWQKKPPQAMKWIDQEMTKEFPIGIIKE